MLILLRSPRVLTAVLLLGVAARVSASITITQQPSSAVICPGTTATLTASATTNSGQFVFWQLWATGPVLLHQEAASGTSFTATFDVPAANGAYWFRFQDSGNFFTDTLSASVSEQRVFIRTDPTDGTFCVGQTASFSAAGFLTGGPPPSGVQWQRSDNGGASFSDILGATSTTYSTTVAASDDGAQFRAVFFESTCGLSATTSAAHLSTTGLISQPQPATFCSGTDASFSAGVVSGATVQWQSGDGITFTDIAGATSPTLVVPSVTTTLTGTQYRATVTSSCGTTLSSAATLTVLGAAQVTLSPSDSQACNGTTASFSAAGIGSVQWESSSDGGTTWTAIEGATNATLPVASTSPLYVNGNQFRARFTNACLPAGVTTAAAKLNIFDAPRIIAQPGPPSLTFCATTPLQTTIVSGLAVDSITGASVPLQWQTSVDGGMTWTDIPGATDTQLPIILSVQQSQFRFRVPTAAACGPDVISSVVAVSVRSQTTITQQPTSVTVCAGATATFVAHASGSDAGVAQWQRSTGGGAFADIPGATGDTLTLPGVTADRNFETYRAVYANPSICFSGEPQPTLPAILQVNGFVLQPQSVTLCEGFNSGARFDAAVTNLIPIQWQLSTDGGATFQDIPGATGPSYTTAVPTFAMNGYRYRARASCGTSADALLTVHPRIQVVTQSSTVMACPGSQATLEVMAIGGNLAYRWEKLVDRVFVTIEGATSSKLVIPAASAADQTTYLCDVSSECSYNEQTVNFQLVIANPTVITSQPQSLAACPDEDAFFSVATDPPFVPVQWRKNGVPIPGAAEPFLVIPNVTAADVATYDAVVGSCSGGSVTSDPATLTLAPPVVITQQPASQQACVGSKVTFTVAASGAIGIGWLKGDVLVGEGPTLTIPSVTAADAGAYQAVAISECDRALSSIATLTVDRSVTVALSGLPTTQIPAGAPVTFTATVSSCGPAVPTGSVDILDGTTAIGKQTLTNGSASFTLNNLSGGAHVLTAQYAGDTNFLTGTSPAVTIDVPETMTISPSSVCQGHDPFTIQIAGSSFGNGASVKWNGRLLPMKSQSSTLLTASVDTTDVRTAGPSTVAVIPFAGAIAISHTFDVTPDAKPPAVHGPSPITIMETEPDRHGASAEHSPQLSAFLHAVSASDNCSTPRVLSTPTFVPVGVTPVVFQAADGAGNIGSVASTVTVDRYGDLNRSGGAPDAADLLLLFEAAAGNATFAALPAAGDLNLDGTIDNCDVELLEQSLVGRIATLPMPGDDCVPLRTRAVHAPIGATEAVDLMFTAGVPNAFVISLGFDSSHLAFLGVENSGAEATSPDVARQGFVLVSAVSDEPDRSAARLLFRRIAPGPDRPMVAVVLSGAPQSDVAVSVVPVN